MKLIHKCIVGSRCYGVNEADSDTDYVELYIEPLTFMTPVFESDQLKNPDTARYSLQKYCRLTADGNPNMIEVLYAPTVGSTNEGLELTGNAWMFWSKKAGRKFLGYMKAQRERLLGLRGQKDVNRPELVEKYGYDTKYAYHIIRLGMLGTDYLRNGYIDFPFIGHDKHTLLSIRNGSVGLDHVLTLANNYENELEDLIQNSKAPTEPYTEGIEKFLQKCYSKNT